MPRSFILKERETCALLIQILYCFVLKEREIFITLWKASPEDFLYTLYVPPVIKSKNISKTSNYGMNNTAVLFIPTSNYGMNNTAVLFIQTKFYEMNNTNGIIHYF